MMFGGTGLGERRIVTDVRVTLAEVEAASERLAATVAKLTDEDVRAPSRLPGWTRGHVLAHLARNADSLVNLLTWARTGTETRMYGSPAERDGGIEARSEEHTSELQSRPHL